MKSQSVLADNSMLIVAEGMELSCRSEAFA
ncbi:hypothetical protein J2T13_001346 [Paenibacillus sp. DS2015]